MKFSSKTKIIFLNENDLSILAKTKFNSIDEAYDFIVNLFEENRAFITGISLNKEMKLLIKMGSTKDIKLTLKYDKENSKINENNKDYFTNEIIQLKNDINDLKEENKALKNELNNLKKFHMNNNPKYITSLTDISNDSFGYTDLDNTFTVF